MTRAAKTWTTSADLATRVRRRWRDGSLPRKYLSGEAFEEMSLPISGPTANEIGDDTTRVRAWIDELRQAENRRWYRIEYKQVGGRYVGRNQIPARPVVATRAEAWNRVGVSSELRTL